MTYHPEYTLTPPPSCPTKWDHFTVLLTQIACCLVITLFTIAVPFVAPAVADRSICGEVRDFESLKEYNNCLKKYEALSREYLTKYCEPHPHFCKGYVKRLKLCEGRCRRLLKKFTEELATKAGELVTTAKGSRALKAIRLLGRVAIIEALLPTVAEGPTLTGADHDTTRSHPIRAVQQDRRRPQSISDVVDRWNDIDAGTAERGDVEDLIGDVLSSVAGADDNVPAFGDQDRGQEPGLSVDLKTIGALEKEYAPVGLKKFEAFPTLAEEGPTLTGADLDTTKSNPTRASQQDGPRPQGSSDVVGRWNDIGTRITEDPISHFSSGVAGADHYVPAFGDQDRGQEPGLIFYSDGRVEVNPDGEMGIEYVSPEELRE